jgi:hypothetical protein
MPTSSSSFIIGCHHPTRRKEGPKKIHRQHHPVSVSDADAERWLDVAAPQVANRRRDSDSPNFQTPIDVRSESIPAMIMMVRIRILHEGR